jgi:uncharacterized membrane protein YjjP (DUF1212 family)
MNSAVSKLFGGILNVFHIAVIAACFVIFFNESANPNVFFIVLAVIVAYVMLVGVVCTLLAIRENLEALVAIQSPKREPEQEPADVQRQEPRIN